MDKDDEQSLMFENCEQSEYPGDQKPRVSETTIERKVTMETSPLLWEQHRNQHNQMCWFLWKQ